MADKIGNCRAIAASKLLVAAAAALLIHLAGSHAQSSPDQKRLINGQLPPMTPAKSSSEMLVLTAEQVDGSGQKTGMKIFTFMTVRAQGTRSPIHMHQFGGQTCIASGEMTLFLEGASPQRAPAGTCYWMPPGRRMAGVNTGLTDAIMFDTFIAPNEAAIWSVVEPGLQNEQDQFSGAPPAHYKH